MKKPLIALFSIIILSALIGTGLRFVFAFTEPSGSPPSSNTEPPITTSSTGQSKAGGLNVATSSGALGVGASASGTYKLEVIGGTLTGLYGSTSGTNTFGLAGVASGSATGVSGSSATGTGIYGSSASGTGVSGLSASSSGGLFYSTGGTYGIYSAATSTSVLTYGGFFKSKSSTSGSAGAYAINTSATGSVYGLYAQVNSTNASSAAVYGRNTGGSGWAGYFEGPAKITGNLTVDGIISAGGGGAVSGSGTTNYITKWTGTSSLGNSIIFDNGTNVGIGTTSPGYKLDVEGAGTANETVGWFNNQGDYASRIAVRNAGRTAYISQSGGTADTTATGLLAGSLSVGVSSVVSPIQFWNGNPGSVKMTILTDGNVGIGTTGPGQILHVYKASGSNYIEIDSGSNGGYVGTDGTNFVLQARNSQDITFYNSAGAVRNVTITNAGNVGIGTTGPTEKLQVAGNVYASGWIQAVGSGYFGGNVGIGTTSPSYKLDVQGTGTVASFNGPIIVGTPTSASHSATKSYVDSVIGGGGASGSFTTLTVTGNTYLATTSGNVGIGTTLPSTIASWDGSATGIKMLNIKETSASARIVIQGNGTNGAMMDWVDLGGAVNDKWISLEMDSGVLKYKSINDAGTAVIADNILVMDASTGNVGVGTTSPAYKLDVAGTAYFSQPVIVGTPTAVSHAATKSYVDSSISGNISGTANYISKFTGSNSLGNSVIYETGGNVGIGTTGPAGAFQVGTSVGGSGLNIITGGTASADSIYSAGYEASKSSDGNTGTRWVSGGAAFPHYWKYDLGVGATKTVVKLRIYTYKNGDPNGAGLKDFTLQGSNNDSTYTVVYTGAAADIADSWQEFTFTNSTAYRYYKINATSNYRSDTYITFYEVEMMEGAGGGSYFLVTAAGNVGIGTTTPTQPLDILASGSVSSQIRLSDVATDATTKNAKILARHYTNAEEDFLPLQFVSNATDNIVRLGGSSGSFNSATMLSFYTAANATTVSGTERMRIDNSGNVGIGTTSPGALLHLNSSAITQLQMQSTGTGGRSWSIQSRDSTGSFRINDDTAGQNRLTIDSSGNVGIGTTSPAYKLDVNGNTRITGDLTVTGTLSYGSIGADWLNANYGIWSNGSLYMDVDNDNNETASFIIRDGADSNVFVVGENGSFQSVGAFYPGTSSALQSAASIYSPSGALAFSTNSLERVRIDSAGNVGIGTSTPGSNLDIQGVSTTGLFFGASNSGARSGIIDFGSGNVQYGYNRTVADAQQNAATYSWASVLGSQGIDSVQFSRKPAGGAWSTLFKIQNDGNVGIGTTSPGAKLEVFGVDQAIAQKIQWSYNAGVTWGSNPADGGKILDLYNQVTTQGGTQGRITFNTDNGEQAAIGSFAIDNTNPSGRLYFATADSTSLKYRMVIDEVGNVGIGTTSPAYKLDVNGNANITGNLNVTGTITGALAGTVTVTAGNVSSGTFGSNTGYGNFTFASPSNVYFPGSGIWNSSGNVGIGTTGNITMPLTVQANTGNGAIKLIGTSQAGSNNAGIFWYNSDGTTFNGYLGNYSDGFNVHNQNNTSMTFSTNALPRVTILNSGNVGIGTTAPGEKLHQYVASGNNWHRITMGTNELYMGWNGSDNIMGIEAKGALRFATNNYSEVMRLTTGGNVGIGTTSPGAKLDVVGDIRLPLGNAYRITTGSGGWQALTSQSSRVVQGYTIPDIQIGADTGDIIFSTATGSSISASERMRILESTGNVGIGSTSPGYKLDVQGGQVNASGGFCIAGDCRASWGAVGGGYWTASGANIYNNNAGNVGIGTTSPGQKLTISGGNIHIISANDQELIRLREVSDAYGLNIGLDGATGDTTFDRVVNNVATEAMRIQRSSGDVGVGYTSTSGYKLAVNGTIYSSDSIYSSSSIVAGRDSNAYHFKAYDGATLIGAIYSDSTRFAIQEFSGTRGLNLFNSSGNGLTVATNGNVGIGTTNPGSLLSLSRSADNADIRITEYQNNNYGPSLFFQQARGTQSSPAIMQANDEITLIRSMGYDGANFLDVGNITFAVDGTPGTNDMPGRIMFYTTPDGASAVVERVRIDNQGNVGIGTTSPAYKLDVNGNTNITGNLNVTGTITGTLAGTVTVTAGNVSSGQFGANTGGGNFSFPGNVGIGTTSPNKKLHIKATTGTEGTLLILDARGSGLDYARQDYFTNDLGTAWNMGAYYNNGDDYFALSNNYGGWNTPFIVKENGNVGIGTTSPGAGLDVRSDAGMLIRTINNVGNFLRLDKNTSATSNNLVFSTAGTVNARIRFDDSVTNRLDIDDGITANARMSIRLDTGNVGIGTTSPSNLLHLYSASSGKGLIIGGPNPSFDFQETDTADKDWRMQIASGSLRIDQINDAGDAYTTEGVLFLKDGGNVGIGTTSPSEKLHVQGNARITGNLQVDGTFNLAQATYNQTSTATSGSVYNLSTSLTGNPASASSAIYYNSLNQLFTQSGNTQNFTGYLYSGYYQAQHVGTGTVSNLYGLQISYNNTSTGAVSNAVGLRISSANSGGGSVAANYGLLIDDLAGTSAAAIYQSGSNDINYFAGNVGIGTTSPNAKLDIQGIFAVSNNAGNYWGFDRNDSDGRLAITESGTERVSILQSGNVGIGTTSPGNLLHIRSATQPYIRTDWSNNLAANDIVGLLDFRGNNASGINRQWTSVYGIVDDATNLSEDASIVFQSIRAGAVSEQMRITSTGNVGIGTTSPGAKLDITGAGGGAVALNVNAGSYSSAANAVAITGNYTGDIGLSLKNTSTGGHEYIWYVTGSGEGAWGGAGGMGIYDNTLSAWRFGITSTGNVGIGTTSPGAKLDVNGDTIFRGTMHTLMRAATNNYNILLFGTAAGSVTNWGIYTSNTEDTGLAFYNYKNPGTAMYFGYDNNVNIVNNLSVSGLMKVASTRNTYVHSTEDSDNAHIYKTGPGVGDFSQLMGHLVLQARVQGTVYRDIIFAGGLSTAGPLMTIKGTGDVGIGSTSPGYKLDVQGGQVNASGGFCIAGDCRASWGAVGGGYWTASGANIYNNNAGNVGIGTTGPISTLQVGSFAMAGGDIATAANSAITFNLNSSAATTNADRGYQLTLLESSALGANKGGAIGFQAVYDASSNIATIAGIRGLRENGTADNFSGYLQFLTRGSAGSNVERMRITSSGNVGIGTTSPTDLLSLQKTSGSAAIRIRSGTGAGEAAIAYFDGKNNVGSADVNSFIGSVGTSAFDGLWLNVTSNHGMRFMTNNTEYMRITSTGNVGIGTTSPAYKLDVNGNANITGNLSVTGTITGTLAGTVTVTAGNVSSGQFGANTGGGNFSFPGNVGIGTTGPSSKLTVSGAYGQIGITDSDNNKAWDISTISDVDLAIREAGTERIYIKDGGNVGIGSAAPGTKLHVDFGAGGYQRMEYDAGGYSGLEFHNGSAATGYISFEDLATDALKFYVGGGAGSDVKMAIQSTGNVGIGTTSPGAKLHVADTTAAESNFIASFRGSDGQRHLQVANYLVGTDNDRVGLYWENQGVVNTRMWMGNDGYLYDLSSNPSSANGGRRYIREDGIGGNVGIGTTSPTVKLDVAGSAKISGNLDMSGNNVSGVNKLTVTTIDPEYTFDGKKYATYVASFAGGVKEEVTGKAKLQVTSYKLQEYEYTIDFNETEEGSDLWLWRKVIDFSKDNVEVLATPYGELAMIAYQIEGNKIIFKSDKAVEISYRLTGRRDDWKLWPTQIK